MALIKCPECGKEISNRAKACIYCGFPLDEYVPKSVETPKAKTEIQSTVKQSANTVSIEPHAKKVVVEKHDAFEKRSDQTTRNHSAIYVVVALLLVVAVWLAINNFVIMPRKYAEAEELLMNGQYNDAISAFEELGSYGNAEQDREYAIGLAQYYYEEYEAALEHFEALDDYRDSQAYFESIIYKPVYSELDSDGKEYTINWSYDKAGRLEYFVESSDEVKTGSDRGKIAWQLRRTYEYDSAGHLVTMVEQTYFSEELSGTTTYTYTYSFNIDGSIKEQQCVRKSDSKTSHSTTTYEYDEEGRVVWAHYQSSGSSSDTQYEYNYRGLVSKEIYTKDNGYTEVHEYSYDKYGNLYRDSYTFNNTNTGGEPTECIQKYWHQQYEVVAVNKPVF